MNHWTNLGENTKWTVDADPGARQSAQLREPKP